MNYWYMRYQQDQKQFRYYWTEESNNNTDYFTKHQRKARHTKGKAKVLDTNHCSECVERKSRQKQSFILRIKKGCARSPGHPREPLSTKYIYISKVTRVNDDSAGGTRNFLIQRKPNMLKTILLYIHGNPCKVIYCKTKGRKFADLHPKHAIIPATGSGCKGKSTITWLHHLSTTLIVIY